MHSVFFVLSIWWSWVELFSSRFSSLLTFVLFLFCFCFFVVVFVSSSFVFSCHVLCLSSFPVCIFSDIAPLPSTPLSPLIAYTNFNTF